MLRNLLAVCVCIAMLGCGRDPTPSAAPSVQKQAEATVPKELPKPSQPVTPMVQPSTEISHPLSPGVKSGVEGLTFHIPNGTQTVRFQLKLRNKNEYSSYRVQLETAQADPIAEYAAQTNPLRVSIPASTLKPGEYVLLLRGKAAGREEEMDDYHFTVK